MVWACVCALLAALAGSAAAARTKKLRRLIAAVTYRFTAVLSSIAGTWVRVIARRVAGPFGPAASAHSRLTPARNPFPWLIVTERVPRPAEPAGISANWPYVGGYDRSLWRANCRSAYRGAPD